VYSLNYTSATLGGTKMKRNDIWGYANRKMLNTTVLSQLSKQARVHILLQLGFDFIQRMRKVYTSSSRIILIAGTSHPNICANNELVTDIRRHGNYW
jgi:hypothetical protein